MKETVELTIEFLLFGFGIYSILFLIVKPFLSDPKKLALNQYDLSACLLIAFTGGLYLLIWIITFFSQQEIFSDRFYGPYWLGFLLQPFLFLPSQLLWFKSLRTKKILRFIIAVSLIISIESIVIYLTSLHRDYLPSSWSEPITEKIKNWLLSLGLFAIVSATFHMIRTRR